MIKFKKTISRKMHLWVMNPEGASPNAKKFCPHPPLKLSLYRHYGHPDNFFLYLKLHFKTLGINCYEKGYSDQFLFFPSQGFCLFNGLFCGYLFPVLGFHQHKPVGIKVMKKHLPLQSYFSRARVFGYLVLGIILLISMYLVISLFID